MYLCEICGLPRDGKSHTNNSGPHACVTALRTRLEEAEGHKQHSDALFALVAELGMSDVSSEVPTEFIRKQLARAREEGRQAGLAEARLNQTLVSPTQPAPHPHPQPVCGGTGEFSRGAYDPGGVTCPGCPDCQPSDKTEGD